MDCGVKSRLNKVCRIFAGAAVALMLSVAAVGPACAQEDTACDPDYMDALEARAWLEAQREISQNQNLIVKPDSVLEYTCFPLFLSELASDAKDMFSETDRWGTIPGQEAGSMEATLQELMSEGMGDYNENNFPHTYLGGRATSDYQLGWFVTRTSYTCGEMAKVWNEAKCLNFFDEQDYDGFYDFAHYNDNDPRQLPEELAQCTPPGRTLSESGEMTDAGDGAGGFNFENMMKVAFNERQDTYVLQTENPNDTEAYDVDTLVTFLDFILPKGVEPASQCKNPPIKTGIEVDRRLSGSYDDAVCPNPGCYYNKSECQ